MRRSFISALLLGSLITPPCVHAGYGKSNHVLAGSFGAVLGANDLDQVKGSGPGGGVSYRYYVSDIFSFGVDVALDYFGDHYSEEDETDIDTQMLSTMLLWRVDFWPRNEFATYASLGTGSLYVEREFHEPTGDRTETTGLAGYFLALGFEGPLFKRWMWGAELRGTDPVGISADSLGLKFTLSRRFGKEMAPLNKGFD
ncbi:MAG: hypothetical protein KCHDKBKB_01348 [Elusimicrobia bacterium]|nr:hypothetical protein [Elusimicrobiota bacterium]